MNIISSILLLTGLLIEAYGVIVLVRTSDKGFNFIIKNLNRIVDEKWNDKINEIRKDNKRDTKIGISSLLSGIFLQYVGILTENSL